MRVYLGMSACTCQTEKLYHCGTPQLIRMRKQSLAPRLPVRNRNLDPNATLPEL